MRGYFLNGINGDHILVFRSEDSEEILRIINRLAACRDKQMKAIAEKLELDWYERQYNNKKEKKRKQ